MTTFRIQRGIVLLVGLASCGNSLHDGGEAAKGGAGGTGQADAGGTGQAGTGGALAAGGTGGGVAAGGRGGGVAAGGKGGGGSGGNCVWANGGGDPTPAPLTCGAHNLNATVKATVDGDQLRLVFSECDVCAGNSLCVDYGDLTGLRVDVLGDWATVVDQAFAPSCPVYTVHLLPSSPTSEGQFHVSGAFSGADQCHQPLSCPIDETMMVLRGDNDAVEAISASSMLNRCSVNPASGRPCAGMTFACQGSVQDHCRGNETSFSCAATWSAALADTSYCRYGGARTFSCDGYNVRVGNATTSDAAYYDASSGALIAIVSYDPFAAACGAGPASFTVPTCPEASPQPQTCPLDGGAPD